MALATVSRSPNSCVSSLRYGVSPHPAQAPENSKSGSRNWVPRTVPRSIRLRGLTGIVSKKATLSRPTSITPRSSVMLIALMSVPGTAVMGHASTHSPQPVQSSV